MDETRTVIVFAVEPVTAPAIDAVSYSPDALD